MAGEFKDQSYSLRITSPKREERLRVRCSAAILATSVKVDDTAFTATFRHLGELLIHPEKSTDLKLLAKRLRLPQIEEWPEQGIDIHGDRIEFVEKKRRYRLLRTEASIPTSMVTPDLVERTMVAVL